VRVLLTCVPGFGHLLPLVPLARGFQDRGHEVRVATSPMFVPEVRRWGLDGVGAGLDWLESAPDEVEVGAGAPDGPGRISWIFRAAAPEPMLRDLQELSTTWRPDLVVFDNVERGGLLFAELTGTPYVYLAHDSVLPSSLLASREPAAVAAFERHRGLDRYRSLRSEVGLPPDPDEQRGHEQVVLLTVPRVLWTFPPQWVLRGTIVPVRPEPADLGPDAELSAWLDSSAGPVAAISLGTVVSNAEVVETSLDGLRTLGYRVVITGSERDVSEDGIFQRPWLPIVQLAAAASVLVTHGGMGTVTTALVHATPMVVVPQAFDHPLTALRLTTAGLGVTIGNAEVTPAAIADAIAHLDTEGCRARSRAVADEIAALPPIRSVIDDLERHAGQPPD
jgi:UDP:flavonoid glycosyltransferase YjiC (YdhE family)